MKEAQALKFLRAEQADQERTQVKAKRGKPSATEVNPDAAHAEQLRKLLVTHAWTTTMCAARNGGSSHRGGRPRRPPNVRVALYVSSGLAH